QRRYSSYIMRESIYDVLCALLLGIGQLCMFTGYDTQLTIVEPVLRSVHDRSPGTIDAHAGYYGPAVCMIVFTFANLVVPWAIGILGSKFSLVLGSMLFSVHIVTFFFIHSFPYYLTSATLGLGYALFYSGHGGYTTEHSTRKTIGRNSALTWALASMCMTVGGIVMLFTIQSPEIGNEIVQSTNMTAIGRSFREYSDGEIRMMYGAFLLVTVCSNAIFAAIPTRSVKDSISKTKDCKNQPGFGHQLKRTFATMGERKMLQLTPLFGYIGLSSCIWVSVYPTTLTFSKKLSEYVYLPAYYSIAFGLSNMLMGFTISAISKRVKNFAQMPTLTIGSVSFATAMVLALLSTPTWATNTPTDELTLLIEPNPYLPLFIAVLFGIGDNCVNTSRTVICALILPEKRVQVFAVSKFHQSLLLAALTFISPLIPMPVYSIVIILYSVVS
ncbi:hypothetical protein PFISCL1PPCAC_14337, partial [Pristionchus fissidentatus]